MLPDWFYNTDIHTHNVEAARAGAVLSLRPGQSVPEGVTRISRGIHPWDTDGADFESQLEAIRRDAVAGRLVAIGECGMDKLRGAPLPVQEDIFVRQLLLAREFGLPVIIHCVRCYDAILRLHKRLRPTVPWIIHGFRGKAELARQLQNAGILLSSRQPSPYDFYETD